MSAPSTDRLYSLTYRPQELALYGDRVDFGLRFAPMNDPLEVTAEHAFVLVLTVSRHLPADVELGQPARTIELIKCGWESLITTAAAVPSGTISEQPGHVDRLLDAIADTINDLARRAGVEPPLTPDVITHLITSYRASVRR